jgi:hypothetical protein
MGQGSERNVDTTEGPLRTDELSAQSVRCPAKILSGNPASRVNTVNEMADSGGMTQIRKPLTTFIVGLLLGLLLAAGISQLASATTGAQPVDQPVLQTQMHQVQLPSARFIALVYGPASDYTSDQLVSTADVLDSVCLQLDRGFTYMSIRDGLAEVQGWSKGEAGLFVSVAKAFECATRVVG